MTRARKSKTQVLTVDSYRVRAIGKLANDVNLGVWLRGSAKGSPRLKADFWLTARGARKLAQKLLRAADKVEET